MPYSTRFSRLALLGVLALLTVAPVRQAEAQFGKRLKDAVQRTGEDKAYG
jgi:hypothetical protein